LTGLYTDNEYGEPQTFSELKIELEKKVHSEGGFWKPVLAGLVTISLSDLENSSPRKLLILEIVADWKREMDTPKDGT
jgi:hypothetical protein